MNRFMTGTQSRSESEFYLILDIESYDLTTTWNPHTPVWCVGLIMLDKNLNEIWSNCYQWNQETKNLLSHYATRHEIRWVIQNASYELPSLRLRGVNILPGSYDDTLVMSHCLCPSNGQYHSLEALGKRYNIPKMDYHAALIEAGMLAPESSKEDAYKVPFNPIMEEYNLRDLAITKVAYVNMLRQLQQDTQLYRAYLDAYLPFVEGVIQMELGVYVDKTKLWQYMAQLGLEILQLRQWLIDKYPMVPHLKYDREHQRFVPKHTPMRYVEFDPDSSYHRIYVLAQEGWEPDEYTETGLPKTGVDYLLMWRDKSEFIDKYVRYSNLTASLSQANQIVTATNDKGLLRGSWNLCNTRTHRMSSSNPNLQNVGSAERDERNIPLREAFVPSKGMTLVNVDFSRIEIVMLAYMMELAGDGRLADKLREGVDPHTANAEMWGVSRPEAKNGQFAVSYGASPQRLAMTVHIPVVDAERIINAINSQTPVIQELKDDTSMELKQMCPPVYDVHAGKVVENGMVRDIFGSRYVYSDINSRDRGVRARAERQAFNVKCQGSVGYLICKLASDFMPFVYYFRARLVLQVHDELVFEVPNDVVEFFKQELRKTFERDDLLVTPRGGVPIRVAIGSGKNWYESKKDGK